MRFIFGLVIVCLASAVQAETLRFCYDPYPPFTFGSDGPAEGGLKVDLLQEVMQRIEGVEATVTLMPWKRCQAEAEAGTMDGILPLFQNTARDEYLAMTVSVADEESALFHRRGELADHLPWTGDFGALARLRLGMLSGSYISDDMEAAFEAGGGITRARDTETLMMLLARDRVDLIALDATVGRYVAAMAGLADRIVRIDRPISRRASYFGLSKASGADTHLGAFNRAIEAMRADGTIDRIIGAAY